MAERRFDLDNYEQLIEEADTIVLFPRKFKQLLVVDMRPSLESGPFVEVVNLGEILDEEALNNLRREQSTPQKLLKRSKIIRALVTGRLMDARPEVKKFNLFIEVFDESLESFCRSPEWRLIWYKVAKAGQCNPLMDSLGEMLSVQDAELTEAAINGDPELFGTIWERSGRFV